MFDDIGSSEKAWIAERRAFFLETHSLAEAGELARRRTENARATFLAVRPGSPRDARYHLLWAWRELYLEENDAREWAEAYRLACTGEYDEGDESEVRAAEHALYFGEPYAGLDEIPVAAPLIREACSLIARHRPGAARFGQSARPWRSSRSIRCHMIATGR